MDARTTIMTIRSHCRSWTTVNIFIIIINHDCLWAPLETKQLISNLGLEATWNQIQIRMDRRKETKEILMKKLIFIEFSAFGRAHPTMETEPTSSSFQVENLPTLYSPSPSTENIRLWNPFHWQHSPLFGFSYVRFSREAHFRGRNSAESRMKNSLKPWKQMITFVAHLGDINSWYQVIHQWWSLRFAIFCYLMDYKSLPNMNNLVHWEGQMTSALEIILREDERRL